jgi:hypothetical protein
LLQLKEFRIAVRAGLVKGKPQTKSPIGLKDRRAEGRKTCRRIGVGAGSGELWIPTMLALLATQHLVPLRVTNFKMMSFLEIPRRDF